MAENTLLSSSHSFTPAAKINDSCALKMKYLKREGNVGVVSEKVVSQYSGQLSVCLPFTSLNLSLFTFIFSLPPYRLMTSG
jgi:hypothetical protein